MRRLLAGLLLVLLTGCAGGSVVPAASTAPVSQLRIGLMEYRFQLSAATLRPGPVTVVVTNVGSAEHDVALAQGGKEIGRSAVLAPGQKQTFQVQVAPSDPVHLECTLPGHDAAGMHASLAVSRR
jgi:plastocyanin